MKTLKLLFLLWLGIFFCWGCDSEKDVIPEQIAKIELNSTQLPVLQEGGTYNMTFTASADWKAEVDETRSVSWLSIVPMSGGAGTVTLSVTTTSNETYDERNATVTLTSGAVSKSFVVSQKQKDALMVTSNKVEVSSIGGGIEIEVKANISFESEVEQSAQEWITPVVTRGLTTSTLLFNVKENENQEKREGKIVIRSGEFVETVTVYQEGSKPTIVLTQDTYTVPSNGESIKVELRSNIDYEVQLPDVDWLTETVTRAFSTHTYYFTISPNDTYDARTANIVFSNKAENLSDTVTVTQMQKDAIIVAQNEYTVDADGGNLEFDVNTNVDFTVEIVDSWIKQQTETRGLVAKSLHFVVEANTDSEKREGTINIVCGDLKQAIKVVQNSAGQQEREALIEFYKAANGDKWQRNDNWCSDKPLSEWYGITISESGAIREIELGWNNVSGNLSEILQPLYLLSNLETLRLLDNPEISGFIPPEICKLKNIRQLLIDTSNLTGEIPSEIGELTQLNSLYLRSWWNTKKKGLQGNLPENLKILQNLEWIDLEYNNLTGDVSILNSLPKLKVVILSNNRFNGNLPEMTESCLVYKASDNNFTGNIPESHVNVYNRADEWGVSEWAYTISNNNLSGKVPDFLTSHDLFRYLWTYILPQNAGYGFDELMIPANNNTVQCYDGSYLNLGDLYRDNEYTLFCRLDLFCTYADPAPVHLAALKEKYGDKGLAIVGMTFSKDTQETIKPFTEYLPDCKIFWERTSDRNEIDHNNPYSLYDALFGFDNYYPMFFVVDKNGSVIYLSQGIYSPFNEYPFSKDGVLNYVGIFS